MASLNGTLSQIRIGDRVAYTCGHFDGVGTVDKFLPNEVIAVRKDDGNFVYPMASECTPIADAPEEIVGAVLDEAPTPLPLTLDTVTELGEVDAEDAVVGAALASAEVLVRICDAADRLRLCERININGVTWLVQVAPEQDTP